MWVRALAYVCVDLPRGKIAPSSFAFSSSSPAIHCSPSLCGVLVSDSVSRSSRPRRLLTHLCHTHHRLSHTSFTHNFVAHSLSQTIFHTQLCHTPSFTHLLCHTTLLWRGTWRHPPSSHVAGVALGNIHFRLAWQALTFGTGLALVARLVAVSRS